MTRGRLQEASRLLEPAAAEAIGQLDLKPCDVAAARLAVSYARAIDELAAAPEALDKLGPKLLAVLESLGATPVARRKVMDGKAPGAPNRVRALRAAK